MIKGCFTCLQYSESDTSVTYLEDFTMRRFYYVVFVATPGEWTGWCRNRSQPDRQEAILSVGMCSSSPTTRNWLMIRCTYRCFWARGIAKLKVPHSSRSFHSYIRCLSRAIPSRMSDKSILRWLHSTWPSRKYSTYSCMSPPQKARCCGGHYMSLHGNSSWQCFRKLLVLPGENSDARGESPRTLPAVHDINVCKRL